MYRRAAGRTLFDAAWILPWKTSLSQLHSSRGRAVGALKHRVRRLAASAAAVVLALTCVATAMADAAAKVGVADLERLKSLATTLRIEQAAADAIRRKDTRALKLLATDIKKTNSVILAVMPFAVRPKAATRSDAEFMALALKLGACHYAGLTLRVAVIGMADGRTPARVRPTYIDATPPVMTDQFAAHVQRCELIERVAPSVRLIGSSCLFDGRNCRESER